MEESGEGREELKTETETTPHIPPNGDKDEAMS